MLDHWGGCGQTCSIYDLYLCDGVVNSFEIALITQNWKKETV
jgi:hypothetical protein